MAVSKDDYEKISRFWMQNVDSHMSKFYEDEETYECTSKVISISPVQLQKLNELLPQLKCDFEKQEETGQTILKFS